MYVEGYHADHLVIRAFWRLVHGMSEIWRRKLLLFCTGCDRVPIMGLRALTLCPSFRHPRPSEPVPLIASEGLKACFEVMSL